MNEILMQGGLVLALLLLMVQTVRLQRKKHHFDAIYDNFERQEKMATLGHLLAGLAHELRTPLGAVSCSLDTDRRAVAKLVEILGEIETGHLDQENRTRLDQAAKALGILQASDPVIEKALERTGQLVRQLRLAGRGEKEEPESLEVNALIEGTLVLLSHELKQETTVDLRLGDLPPVKGWAGPLGQVFLNLILNAQQAMGGPGTVTVTSTAAGGEVTVTVRDTGPGLPDNCREKLFEPGFSTKSQDEGTGLGLFISRRIVERHGGRITADNGPDGGAVFTVVLPAGAGGSAEAGS